MREFVRCGVYGDEEDGRGRNSNRRKGVEDGAVRRCSGRQTKNQMEVGEASRRLQIGVKGRGEKRARAGLRMREGEAKGMGEVRMEKKEVERPRRTT